jgi:hypothetical protein
VILKLLIPILLALNHPVYPPPAEQLGLLPSLRSGVRAEMEFSPEQLADMVPAQRGLLFSGCPNCHGGAEEYYVLEWKFGMGDTVRCKYCGMVFPNEKFPENTEKVIISPSGQRQVYRWYTDEKGAEYYFEPRAWFDRSYTWVQDTALNFAQLYALTGDDQYGDRAAALIGRFAVRYPDYPMLYDHPASPVRFWPADQKYPYPGESSTSRPSKLYHWAYGDIPSRLIKAYDLLAGRYDFTRIEPITAPNIEALIKQNLIQMSYDFFVARPDRYDNMMPYTYQDMIIAGRVGGFPEMVHHAIEGARALVSRQFFADGWWHEGTGSYHWQTVTGLINMNDLIKGYNDPQDYAGKRLVNPDLASEIPMIGKALQVAEQAVLPNGRMIPINDTHDYDRRSALTQSVSRLWSGLGHAVLGAGNDDSQFQAHLNWSGNFGHSHSDNGSIILFAFGKELLSDIGYTHTKYRNWTIQSASHNMVIVDTISQRPPGDDPLSGMGNMLFFEGSDPHVGVIDVDASPATRDCKVYRRRLVHVHAAQGRDYVLDVFDVEGGTTHDFFLHGSSDELGEIFTTPTLQTKIETLVPEWGGRGKYDHQYQGDSDGKTYHTYDFLRQITMSPVNGPCAVQWRVGDVNLRAHLITQPGSELYTYQSPTIRNTKEDDNKVDDFQGWGMMLRHAGPASRFVAVYEPFRDATGAWVDAVDVTNNQFTVRYGGVTDTISLDADRVRVQSSAGWRYDSGAPFSGKVAAISGAGRVAVELDAPPPALRALRLMLPGGDSFVYPVESVEGKSVILAADPGLAYDAAASRVDFLAFPQISQQGSVSYVAFPR